MTRNIILNTLLFSALAFLIVISQVFVFWFIYGEGAESGRITDLWHVNLILEYLPLVIVLSIILFRTFKRYKNKELEKVKANFITILILIILYLFRYEIMNLIG